MPEREWLDDMICFVDRSEIKSPMIAAVHENWVGIRGPRPFPPRSEIDPIHFSKWLPYLSLADFATDPFRVYYRLVGTEVARFADEDFSHKWLDETGWPPHIVALNTNLYRRLWENRAPLFGLSLVDWDRRENYSFEWGLFPLSDDGTHVSGCLSVDDFTKIAGRSHMLR
jgi:hypothetical protein